MGLTTLGKLCKYGLNSSGKVGIPTLTTLETNKQTNGFEDDFKLYGPCCLVVLYRALSKLLMQCFHNCMLF